MGEEANAGAPVRSGAFRFVRRPIVPLRGREWETTMDDDRHMRRALELAAVPARTSPNPRVGAVVVRDGAVIGEGYHAGYGLPHAETEALAGIDARGATVYVNLEPCNHHASTPPCTEVLIAAGVERVVAAISDPDERTRGKGFDRLRRAGVIVDVGTLDRQAAALNAPFIHHRTTGRAFVSLKLAQTIDGRLASADGSSRWITGPEARGAVHERRARVDAVMVGAGTATADDPLLTARDVGAEIQPLRVIVDSTGRTSTSARAFGSDGQTVVATTGRCSHERQLAYKEAGAEVLLLPSDDAGVDLRALAEELGRRGVLEVLCEGGAELASSLLRDDLVDRLEIHTGPVVLGAGPELHELGLASLTDARRWTLGSTEALGDDVLSTYHRRAG
jgi:diaminohydroxyphosphoribosylaminopyrimidine deaminase/5-amino-6-(5-phosphoribosylamino)uracil reductase